MESLQTKTCLKVVEGKTLAEVVALVESDQQLLSACSEDATFWRKVIINTVNNGKDIVMMRAEILPRQWFDYVKRLLTGVRYEYQILVDFATGIKLTEPKPANLMKHKSQLRGDQKYMTFNLEGSVPKQESVGYIIYFIAAGTLKRTECFVVSNENDLSLAHSMVKQFFFKISEEDMYSREELRAYSIYDITDMYLEFDVLGIDKSIDRKSVV